MKVKTLSKSEIKIVNEKLQKYDISLTKKDLVQLAEDEFSYLKINQEIAFFYNENELLPTLKTLLKNNFLKTVIVDMGAVKFICNGADIMRQGITAIQPDIKEGEIITVIDEKNHKPLMVGKALFSSEAMEAQTEGKVIKSLHYVGDEIWNLS